MTANGCTGRTLFRDDDDREQFLTVLAQVSARRTWWCRMYCLLSTHFHLLLETTNGDLAAGMQFLNARYAEWANHSRAEKGHVFRARYNAVLVTTNSHLTWIYRYIAMNPVDAGLSERPEEWPWSGYAQLLGLEPSRQFLDVRQALLDFGPVPAEARSRLRAFVKDEAMSSSDEDVTRRAA